MKNIFPCKLVVFIVCLISSIHLRATTYKSATSGNWKDATTWSPASVPSCGDTIIIQSTHTVSITTQQNYTSCALPLFIMIYGKLMFYNGSKLSLPCNSSIIVFPGGIIDHDTGLSNSNLINICGNVEWNSNSTVYGLACLPPNTAYCNSILLVELVSFTAEPCNDNKICLKWESANEFNNDYYVLERSADAIDFIPIYTIPSTANGGNSQNKINYSFIDEAPLTGTDYYRLKQVEKNGKFTYSDIILSHLDAKSGVQFLIFPNYNSGEFTAQVSGLLNTKNIKVLLKDALGNIVYQSMFVVDGTTIELNVSPEKKLAKGYYFCSFIVNNEEHVIRMLVSDL